MRATRLLVAIAAAMACLAASMPAAAGGYRHHHHSRGGVFLGFGVGLGVAAATHPYWYGPRYYRPYPAYTYYYPPVYYPPVVVSPPPVTYIELPQFAPQPAPQAAPNPANFWYFCQASGAYYPYVQQCPGGWQRVSPTPPGG